MKWRACILLLMTCGITLPTYAGWFSFDAGKAFDASAVPNMPDYAEASSWVWGPGATRLPTPVPFKNVSTAPAADVFYLAPTVFLSESHWNADPANASYRSDLEETAKQQVGMFQGIARVYAPYYRQATFYAFAPPSEGGPAPAESQKALDLAYADVSRAFDYYMQHENKGRPLFIVSHSQGSYLAVRLLQDKYAAYRLKRKLVAAYLVGENIGTETFGPSLPFCTSPNKTACFATWKTVRKEAKPLLVTGNLKGKPVCTNPLTFAVDHPAAAASANLGGVPETFDRVDPAVTGAACDSKGMLRIDSPVRGGYPSYQDDYHESDLNLFFMNVRQDAMSRLLIWQQKRGAYAT